jgi:predicted component of type VI protein secretion system
LDLNEDVADVIKKYEPRAFVVAVESKIDENSGIELSVDYYVQNSTQLQTLSTNITRTS